MKTFLPIYLLVYVFAAFFWRSYVVWKKTGINPVVFKTADTAHDFIGRIFKLLFASIVAVVFIYSFFANLYEFLLPIRFMELALMRLVGGILLIISFAWTIFSQAQMGNSWRIGIDGKNRTELVSGGVFNISRNPIFLGMKITLLGLLLVMPNALTLLAFVMGLVLINVQVRLEEEYLARLHSEAYENYRQRVPRWL